MSGPRLHAIFTRQIDGDQALLRLAQQRFRLAGLGAELYPASPDELAVELRFAPRPEMPVTVHVPRHLRLLNAASHDQIAAFAACHPPRVYGLIAHDQPEVATRFDDYVAAVRRLDQRLQAQGPGPWLFLEYAAGLEIECFIELFHALRDCPRISCCIDISHLGIRQTQRAFAQRHPGVNVCRLKPDHPDLPALVAEVQDACRTALPAVCHTIEQIGALGKPLHFHLHDGHPSSTYSVFGVSDHLSFDHPIPVPFTYQGETHLPTLYGTAGLRQIVQTARQVLPDDRLSFTLEIHPQQGRTELAEHSLLFRHWRIKDNAERMNHWLDVLLRNHRLLREFCGHSLNGTSVAPRTTAPTPLFICHANCCRSVLARFLFAHHYPNEPVLSAGVEAGDGINHNALRMLAHWGINARAHQPRQLDRTVCEQADAIFVMGPGIMRRVLEEYGLDLASRTYLFADPFSVPHSFLKRRYLVNDPSFEMRSPADLARDFDWFHERVRQIHDAMHGRGLALVPASAYLNVLHDIEDY